MNNSTDLRLSQLRQFLLVVETKSYQTAARLSFRSQPALSQSIAQLETRLGAPLFESGARTTLTPFGESCLPLIRDALTNMDRAIGAMHRIADVSAGRLAFAILPSIARQWLPALLRKFNAAHPNVEVRVYAEGSVRVEKLVAEGEVDFGISSSPSDESKIAFEPLVRDQFGLMCRSDHRYAKAKSLKWERLANEPIIGGNMHRLLENSPVAHLLARPKIYASNLPTLVGLVREGVGVIPVPAVGFPIEEPEISYVPLVAPVALRTLGILTMKDRSLFPSARVMVDILKDGIADERLTPEGSSPLLDRMIKRLARQGR
ncbi:MAG: LysR substrate-binding domain-containing protein [Pigmentiphaga sp.]|uniref:LysR family transcriptional regulator n=1 Tax=Pigmentiphaga sp. TaxID=1977564 RepID=UPI0029AB59A6|nr:LysR substrate-binding domain-containing protein [Pigmentiphaga sp.]MDX3905576.1 LysR substrate-binding domain-containing protein [Pigmentiphaga sp.]